MFPFFIDVKISVRSNRRGNQKWITQRNWRHWTDKTQDEDKQNKTKSTQKAKARSNMDHTKNLGVNRSAHESKHLPLITHPLLYSFVNMCWTSIYANNNNKKPAVLQKTRGNDEPNIVFMRNS
jgi:hypothetical protein